MELPNELRLALASELRGRDQGRLAQDAAVLSAQYRNQRAPAALTPDMARAYAAVRMPATYAALAAAFEAMASLLPAFAPRTLLDAGAGTGAALWAAAATWPGLAGATLLERDQGMADLGRRLLGQAQRAPLRAAEWRRADLAGRWEAPPHDLVTASYALGELPPEQLPPLVARLWERAGSAMVLVEPGTPQGWATIRAAREQLRSLGACIVAPCPHQGACPMPAGDWCHFAQRIGRSREHRAAKGGDLGYEDEKYSYVAVARAPGAPIAARVLRHPLLRPGRVELALCATSGLRSATVTRTAGQLWRRARDLRWGDALPQEMAPKD